MSIFRTCLFLFGVPLLILLGIFAWFTGDMSDESKDTAPRTEEVVPYEATSTAIVERATAIIDDQPTATPTPQANPAQMTATAVVINATATQAYEDAQMTATAVFDEANATATAAAE